MLVLYLRPIKINEYIAMNKEERYRKLRAIVQQYLPEDVDSKEITDQSHFVNELNINSANLVDIVLDVEDAFDIRLENEDMNQMQTVAAAVEVIEVKLKAKPD